MDHDELLLAPYTTAQANAQVNALPAEYGAQGRLALSDDPQLRAGASTPTSPRRQADPALMPVEYTLLGPPKPWTPADVVAVAGLIGGIFGDGGGGEVAQRGAAALPAGPARPAGGRDRVHRVQGAERPGRPDDRGGQVVPLRDPRHVNPATHRHPRPPRRAAQGRPGGHHARAARPDRAEQGRRCRSSRPCCGSRPR